MSFTLLLIVFVMLKERVEASSYSKLFKVKLDIIEFKNGKRNRTTSIRVKLKINLQ